MLGYNPGDIVVVPFPFTERDASKRRPALVCSSAAYNRKSRHVVLAMITTSAYAAWPGDVALRDLAVTGLPAPSTVRWKLFTLDESLVLRRAGKISARDRVACHAAQPVTI